MSTVGAVSSMRIEVGRKLVATAMASKFITSTGIEDGCEREDAAPTKPCNCLPCRTP